jgi:hypothetical protein
MLVRALQGLEPDSAGLLQTIERLLQAQNPRDEIHEQIYPEPAVSGSVIDKPFYRTTTQTEPLWVRHHRSHEHHPRGAALAQHVKPTHPDPRTVPLQSNQQSHVTRVPVDVELWWFVTRHPGSCRIFHVVRNAKICCTLTKKLNFGPKIVEVVEFFLGVTPKFRVVELLNRKKESHVTPPVDLIVIVQ